MAPIDRPIQVTGPRPHSRSSRAAVAAAVVAQHLVRRAQRAGGQACGQAIPQAASHPDCRAAPNGAQKLSSFIAPQLFADTNDLRRALEFTEDLERQRPWLAALKGMTPLMERWGFSRTNGVEHDVRARFGSVAISAGW
jgi:hypothetical protein